MNVELAEYLLGLDKWVVLEGEIVKSHVLHIGYPMDLRIMLATPDDLEQNLLIKIWESDKKAFKIGLHHQDQSTQNGLLRVDFNGRHVNPVEVLPTVPEKFHPFAGQWLDGYAGHIHYVVDGYKPLVWAIPLQFDDFPIKSLTDRSDYLKTLKAFFSKINLKTDITFNHQMTLL